MSTENLLALATTALVDLSNGFPPGEINAREGKGLDNLLRDLVNHLRFSGYDDEGAWDCDATDHIPVAMPGHRFTVILLYPQHATDGELQTYTGVTQADGPAEAAQVVKRMASASCDGAIQPGEFQVIGVIRKRSGNRI